MMIRRQVLWIFLSFVHLQALLLTLNEWKTSRILPEISDVQWDQLELLREKLTDWNEKVNLISRKDIDRLVPAHIIPSLAIAKIRRFDGNERVIDIGTGGGFPGLPLAIVCPDAHFTLLDSNGKKMMVVCDLAESIGLKNVNVVHGRAENSKDKTFDFLLGRAVSNLPNFLSFSSHLMTRKSLSKISFGPGNEVHISSGLLYIKGGDYSQELLDANVGKCASFSIQTLLENHLETDKNVLYIPADEILQFSKRMIESS